MTTITAKGHRRNSQEMAIMLGEKLTVGPVFKGLVPWTPAPGIGVKKELGRLVMFACFAVCLALGIGAPDTNAMEITLVPSATRVGPSDPLSVSIVLSRGDEAIDTPLAAWSLDFSYSSRVFRPKTVLLGDRLGQTDIIFGEAIGGWSDDPIRTTTSLLHIFEVSLLSGGQLSALQRDAMGEEWLDSYVLATVVLLTLPNAPANFFTPFAAGEFVLSDPDGRRLAIDLAIVSLPDAVKTFGVSEPSSLALLGFALLPIWATCRRPDGDGRLSMAT